MTLLVDQLLLLLSVSALATGAWKLAGSWSTGGLMRGLAAASIAAAAAIANALLLGIVALGGSAPALSAAALLTGAILARLGPTGAPPAPAPALGGWWQARSPAGRLARGALAGALGATLIWLLRHPSIGLDSLADHLALPVEWVQGGRPGAIVLVNPAFSFANWPISHELLIAWVLGLSHNLVGALLPTPAALVLLLVALRAGLAALAVPPARAWLTCLVAITLPIALVQLPGPNNDLPAVAWTACAAALVAGARRGEPGLLAPAIVSGGLAVGTKTTPVLLVAVALVCGLWALRAQLRAHAAPLGAGLVLAVLAGGLWYVRNLLTHGSPLWPLQSLPGGDPVPAPLRSISPSFLAHAGATLRGRTGDYADVLAGGLVVLAGAVLVPLRRGRRGVLGAALVAASALLWAASPYTGNHANTTLALGATRYLLPTLVAAVVVVALSPRRDRVAEAVLAVALVLNLIRDSGLGFPAVPSPGLIVAGAGAGVVAAAVTAAGVPASLRWRAAPRRLARPAALGGILGLALVVLLAPVGGFMAAHAGTGEFDAGIVRWLNGQAAYREGTAPVAVAPAAIAVLAGARLRHPLSVVPALESCARIHERVRVGWLVVERGAAAAPYVRWAACLHAAAPTYLDPAFAVFSSSPRRP